MYIPHKTILFYSRANRVTLLTQRQILVSFSSLTMKKENQTNTSEDSRFTCEKEVGIGRLIFYRKYCYKALDRVGSDMRKVDTCQNSCRKSGSGYTPTYEQFNRLNLTKVYHSFSLSYNIVLEQELEDTLQLEVSVRVFFLSFFCIFQTTQSIWKFYFFGVENLKKKIRSFESGTPNYLYTDSKSEDH